MFGYVVLAVCGAFAICLLSWSAGDASLLHSSSAPTRNLLGPIGAILSDLIIHLFGLTGVVLILPPVFWALQLITLGRLDKARTKLAVAPAAIILLAAAAAAIPKPATWPLSYGFGGLVGEQLLSLTGGVLAMLRPERAVATAGLFCLAAGILLMMKALGLSQRDLKVVFRKPNSRRIKRVLRRWDLFGSGKVARPGPSRREPTLHMPGSRAGAHTMRAMEPSFPAADPHHPFAYAPRDPFPQPDLSVDETSDIARRFAPSRRAADATAPEDDAARAQPPAWLDGRNGTGDAGASPDPHGRADDAFPPRQAARPPAQFDWPQAAQPRRYEPAFEDLYGRAVAIVLRDRKVSSDHLRGCLHIGYMRASDLIERMEKEGVVGAPLYNGVRPILIGGPGSDEI